MSNQKVFAIFHNFEMCSIYWPFQKILKKIFKKMSKNIQKIKNIQKFSKKLQKIFGKFKKISENFFKELC